jgi:hypothetical protein
MDQNQRRARIINMRKGKPLPHIRTAPAPVPDAVFADLDAIDAATEDPTIRAATARIRAALDGGEQPTTERPDVVDQHTDPRIIGTTEGP